MIYLDNAATTALHPDVRKAMVPFEADVFGNPSSLHAFGRQARAGVDGARAEIAKFLGCRTDELVFTSGGTESIHAALVGALLPKHGPAHIVTTSTEHHAVLHHCAYLQSYGIDVTYVAPQQNGVVLVDDVLAAVRDDTKLVSVMSVNNELGFQNPVTELGTALKATHPNVLFHSDMVQALGTRRLNWAESQVDLASFSAHKVHGPKGVGALLVRRGCAWRPVMHGGSQERGLRAGTENVAAIVGFGAAVGRLAEHWDEHLRHVQMVRQAFWSAIQHLPGLHVNGPEDAVPTILNVAFDGVKNDVLLMRLDLEGVAASAGSACTAGSLEPSHVLAACGRDEDRIRGSVRFSFSELNSVQEAVAAGAVVSKVVEQLRSRQA